MESKHEMIATSLRMRANYIETDDVLYSRNDAIRVNEANDRERRRLGSATYGEGDRVKIKELNMEQQELVIALRKLADKIQHGN